MFWKERKGCEHPLGKQGLGKTKRNFKEEGGEFLVY